jgi:hypothetical protein
MMKLTALLLCIALCRPAFACDGRMNTKLANWITSELAVRTGKAAIVCLGTKNDDGRCSLLCTSDRYLAHVDIALLFITTSAGTKMRKLGVSKFAYIIFSDRALYERYLEMRVPAAVAARFMILPGEHPDRAAFRAKALYDTIDFRKKPKPDSRDPGR